MIPAVRTLFAAPADSNDENLTPLAEGTSFRLEHIASHGAATPPGFWYDQEQTEWVALIRGLATLEFEDGELKLGAGDAIVIPAHARHRVTHTSVDAVWLALHYSGTGRGPLETCDSRV